MEKVKSNLHSEFADDNTVLSHGTNLDEVTDVVIEDCDGIINEWCPKSVEHGNCNREDTAGGRSTSQMCQNRY